MRVKIVKSNFNYVYINSINKFIGQEYEVKDKLPDESVIVYIPEWGDDYILFKGEYEIVTE